MEYKLLDKVDSPADIKKMDTVQLRWLCEELRSYMVDCCSSCPGHLGSSLGAVELIVGLHYVYDTPSDKIVFDVSHQAYAHKILTGRREAFRGLRTFGGISGFTNRDESPFDAFGAGHSSTSVSAALGFAQAASIRGTGEKAVAFIGDGSLTGGLALEGLNNAGDSGADLLVIVNDNNLSIDANIGAVHRHLMKLTMSPFYNTMKGRIWNVLGDTALRRHLQSSVIRLKRNIVAHSGGDMFEALGFRYFGPIDGNDIDAVVEALEKMHGLHGPRVLHAITKKGKGYAPAEKEPVIWHFPGKFDAETGQRHAGRSTVSSYPEVFGETLVELAKSDDRVVGVTPAMSSNCRMDMLAKEKPEAFFDVGIAEEHAVTFSAALAASGMRPFCNIFSSFAQRAYDQIVHDVALQRLPVTLCLDRAGLVGTNGPTHHGVFDLAAFRSIPGCIIASPRNESQLRNLMYSALQSDRGPYIIRYPNCAGEGVQWKAAPFTRIATGTAELLRKGRDVAIVALGPMANRAFEAAEQINAMSEGAVDPAVWDCRFLKPFDKVLLEELLGGGYRTVFTIEDGVLKGGLFSELAEAEAASPVKVRIIPVGIGDVFVSHGAPDTLFALVGLTKEQIVQKVLENQK